MAFKHNAINADKIQITSGLSKTLSATAYRLLFITDYMKVIIEN